MRQQWNSTGKNAFDAAAFAVALLDPEARQVSGLAAPQGKPVQKRFAVYRNNLRAGLIETLRARFPATCKIVGEDFFKAAARCFALAKPPRSPLIMFYGDEFPDFLAGFEPAQELPYLADVARLEAARTHAYHAPDAEPLEANALKAIAPEHLPKLRFVLHPSLRIVASNYPIVTIFAMNSGEQPLAPITDWQGEDALIIRPRWEVSVRALPSGGKAFLQSLAAGEPLEYAAQVALAANESFDLALNLAALFAGRAIALTRNQDLEPPT